MPRLNSVQFKRINWILIAIVLVGLVLRVWAIDFGLPFTTAPDEAFHVTVALRMFREVDPNPHWLNYPSLMFDLTALVYLPYFLVGKAIGVLSAPADIPYPEIITVGVGKSFQPAQFLLARGLTALFGVLSIVALYKLARELHPDQIIALAAAWLFAISPASVYNSHLFRPDTYVVFFVLLTCLMARRILENPNYKNYLWAGVCAGLAVSSKYSVPLIVLPILAAHFIRWGGDGWRRREIYLALAASVGAFLLTTPFALLDWQGFVRDMGYEVSKQVEGGHAGFEGGALRWYLEYLWSSEGLVAIAAVAAMVGLLWHRSRDYAVVLAFPIAYFVFISMLIVRNDRTILPMLPFLHLFAALFVLGFANGHARVRTFGRQAELVLILVLTALVSIPTLSAAIVSDAGLNVKDSRETARVWIETNLPAGARIALEPYAPYVDRRKFYVEGVDGMITHSPKWYNQNGFEYLVFSYGAYGRFFENRAHYPTEAQQYEDFFSRNTLLKRFDDGLEIRIYQIHPVDLPAHRVAARFGVYSGWVEFVGYDLRSPTWASGDTQRLGFHWRALESRREPLMLTARLIDQDGREISNSRSLLFGDAYAIGAWPESIARAGIDVVVPSNALSGLYRVQLEVDAEGIGRVPLLSSANQPVADKLFIGPFKVTGPPLGRDEVARSHPVNANFGKLISLLGYTATPPMAHAGDPVLLTLYWRADLKMDENYTVFVHLLDKSGGVRAQVDSQPRGGNYPTSLWDRAEVVRDDYTLNLPADLASGDYRFSIGLYQYPSLARLPMSDASGRLLDDHVILDDAVQVK